jgi:hypothetical protein
MQGGKILNMHMSTETALDLADGLLEPAQAEFWETHILTCTTCMQDMADWRNLGINLKRSHLENAPSKDLERAFDIFGPARTAGSKLRQVLAGIIFDSFQQPAFAGARGGATAARQLVLRAEEFDIHVKIWGEQHHRQLLGQLLSRSGDSFEGAAHFHLLRNGERLESTSMDDMGEFHFTDIPEGDLSLQIDLPNLTVIGALKTGKV